MIRPIRNPDAEPAAWPIKRLPKSADIIEISFVGRLHDGMCRCRSCKPSLVKEK